MSALVGYGREWTRLLFGEERDREESPCPGCGVYFFDEHEIGCELEECPRCGGPLAQCGCFELDGGRAGA
ncbi:MAG: hypothetical protein IPJ34_08150 [Myxococcales bacterium]|nr:hypothetical protein [Myxococcales bacterium]